jgi:hypothetical protein
MDDDGDWPKLIWLVDAREEKSLVPIATRPAPKYDDFARRGGRFGAHNLHENVPLPTVWQSEDVILGTFFNGGLRAYDISNQYEPKEVAAFVPPAPEGAPQGTIKLNDGFVEERPVADTVG